MAKFNEIRFFLVVSLMILPSWALDVSLANDNGNYNIDCKIKPLFRINKYITSENTHTVILYVVNATRFSQIMKTEHRQERMKISTKLVQGFELLYMGIDGIPEHRDIGVIRDFIRCTFNFVNPKPPFNYCTRKFVTIGDINLDYSVPGSTPIVEFTKYEDYGELFSEELLTNLNAIGASSSG